MMRATLQSWAINLTTNRLPSNFAKVVKSITEEGGVFETKFKTDPIDTSIKLYGAANQTIEAPDWRSIVAKEVNVEKKVTFEETEGSHVHCILRFISHYVNTYAHEKITKACDGRLKCIIRKSKARSDKNVKGCVPVTLPGLGIQFWLRHKHTSTTYE